MLKLLQVLYQPCTVLICTLNQPLFNKWISFPSLPFSPSFHVFLTGPRISSSSPRCSTSSDVRRPSAVSVQRWWLTRVHCRGRRERREGGRRRSSSVSQDLLDLQVSTILSIVSVYKCMYNVCVYVAVIRSKRTRSLMMPRSTSASRSLHSLPPHLSPSPSSPAYSPPSPHALSISSSYTRRYIH